MIELLWICTVCDEGELFASLPVRNSSGIPGSQLPWATQLRGPQRRSDDKIWTSPAHIHLYQLSTHLVIIDTNSIAACSSQCSLHPVRSLAPSSAEPSVLAPALYVALQTTRAQGMATDCSVRIPKSLCWVPLAVLANLCRFC